jgi:hypothetical protein
MEIVTGPCERKSILGQDGTHTDGTGTHRDRDPVKRHTRIVQYIDSNMYREGIHAMRLLLNSCTCVNRHTKRREKKIQHKDKYACIIVLR